MAKRVEILFTKEARQQIKDAVAARQDGYQLPESFDTVGQVFEEAVTAYADNGFISVTTTDRKDKNTEIEYLYPSHSIDRVKIIG